jgi:hypothetical protein
MAKQEINLGTGPNTGTGEPIRGAFQKVNENFTEVYDLTNAASSLAQTAFDAANNAVGSSANTGDFKFEDDEIYTETGKFFIYTMGAGEDEDNTVEISSDNFRVNANKNITLVVDEDVNIIAGNGTGTPREWIFRANGNLELPTGGIITEGVVTDNPTIELAPATPEAESQKLVIKGGFPIGEEIHLHLTTGDLQETNIFLGTDEHNFRTKIDGSVELTSYDYEDEYSYSLNFKKNVLQISSTDDSDEEDLFIKAEDDLYLDALSDDVIARANDDIRLRTGYDFEEDDYKWEVRFTDSGEQIFFSYQDVFDYGRITPNEFDEGVRGLTLEGADQIRLRVDGGVDLIIESDGNLYLPGSITFPDDSTQNTAFIFDPNPTFDFTTTNNLKVESGIQVNYSNIANATGTVTHNCADGQIFNHITPVSNWTANFTNLELQNGYSTTLTLVINQGETGFIANTILIDNSVTTIKWEGNVVPTPSINSIDVLTFKLLKTGFNFSEVIILGQLTNFG